MGLTASSGVLTGSSVCPYEDHFRAVWDDYVCQHPLATLFHLTAWKRVIEKTFGFKSRYLFVEEDGKVRGVLPLFLVSSVIQGLTLISTPFAVYGGPCADNEEIARLLRQAACRLAEEEAVQYLELRNRQSSSEPRFHTKELYVSFDLELPSDDEQLMKVFPRDTRYMIRKGQKNGLQAIRDNTQLELFYEIYCRSFHHLGTPVFPRRLFHNFLEEFGRQCELLTVWQGAKALASVLSFRFRDWILPYFGGSLLEGRPVAANNFMYWEVMKQAMAEGVRFFDFGRSKLGSGAYDFKTQWNMQERPLPYQFYLVKRNTMPNFSPANPKFKKAIEIWRAMPFALTKMIGPSVVKLFP
jgi:FemAB-related protein (PEP-CTERM system-associated)